MEYKFEFIPRTVTLPSDLPRTRLPPKAEDMCGEFLFFEMAQSTLCEEGNTGFLYSPDIYHLHFQTLVRTGQATFNFSS
jgi:hypothetical protein